jgi:hypothetical protein
MEPFSAMSRKITTTAGDSSKLQQAVERVVTGRRDPEAIRKACERMDRMRAEIEQKHGFLDVAVPSIRELRDA